MMQQEEPDGHQILQILSWYGRLQQIVVFAVMLYSHQKAMISSELALSVSMLLCYHYLSSYMHSFSSVQEMELDRAQNMHLLGWI